MFNGPTMYESFFEPKLTMPVERPEMCREFLFKTEKGNTKETFLDESDIVWFLDQLRAKLKEQYHASVRPHLEKLLNKYIVQDGYSLNIYFAREQNRFVQMQRLRDLIPYDLQDEYYNRYKKSPVKTKKVRIDYDSFNTPICKTLKEIREDYDTKRDALHRLHNDLMKLLSFDELYQVFPGAKDLFKKRKKDSKVQRPSGYDFVNDLLER